MAQTGKPALGLLFLGEGEKTVNIKQFAENYRLRTALDEDATTIIPGKSGQIYENEDEEARFGVIFQSEKFKTAKAWCSRRRAAIAQGLVLHQDGDCEGSLLFNPSDPKQVRFAIRLAGIHRKKVLTEDQLAKLAAHGKQHLFKKRKAAALEGP